MGWWASVQTMSYVYKLPFPSSLLPEEKGESREVFSRTYEQGGRRREKAEEGGPFSPFQKSHFIARSQRKGAETAKEEEEHCFASSYFFWRELGGLRK